VSSGSDWWVGSDVGGTLPWVHKQGCPAPMCDDPDCDFCGVVSPYCPSGCRCSSIEVHVDNNCKIPNCQLCAEVKRLLQMRWPEKRTGKPTMKVCFHDFHDGYGMYGDAITCQKCGFSKYPKVYPLYWFYRLLGRVKKVVF
jgi:hypothetical protein